MLPGVARSSRSSDVQDARRPARAATPPLDAAVVLKLNGGLGTSMGMTGAKSLLEAKDGLSFLDVIARQVLGAARAHGARLPLVLMNSFRTRDDVARGAARATPELAVDVPLDFVQNKEPKILRRRPEPVEWPDDPALEWCPPGHGDLYTALVTSGMLDALLERGYRYAFVSNSDNLGAVLEPRILAWIAREEIPFADGGHRPHGGRPQGRPHRAARRRRGSCCARPRRRRTRTSTRFRTSTATATSTRTTCGSTCEALDGAHARARRRARAADDRQPQDGRPDRQVDARRRSSSRPRWARRSTSSRARARCASRATRFAPVKTTDDLLALRSDAYVLTDDARVELGRRARRRRRRSSSSTPTTTSCCATSTRASRRARRRWCECERLTVRGRRDVRPRRRRARRR